MKNTRAQKSIKVLARERWCNLFFLSVRRSFNFSLIRTVYLCRKTLCTNSRFRNSLTVYRNYTFHGRLDCIRYICTVYVVKSLSTCLAVYTCSGFMTPLSPRKPKVEHQARVLHVLVFVSRVRYGLRSRINTKE